MGSAIDLFVTYRFLKLLTTPFNRTDAYKLGIIDKNGHRVLKPKSTKPQVEHATTQQKNAYKKQKKNKKKRNSFENGF